MAITEVTRRALFDEIRAGEYSWAGTLDEVTFLDRLYPLSELPSTDDRFDDADGDIRQHRFANMDWEDDWVFSDARFGLATDDDTLLAFLAETVHPAVRPSRDEVLELVAMYNRHLVLDGVELVETAQISGRPVFVGRERQVATRPAFDPEDWELQWPRDIVTTELGALVAGFDDSHWLERSNLFAREAFGPRAVRYIEDLDEETRRTAFSNVANGLSTLPTVHDYGPYFEERETGVSGAAFPHESLPGEFLRLFERLREGWYFAKAIPDSQYDGFPGNDAMDAALERRTGRRGMWSGGTAIWTEPTLFTVVEVLGELVARPRSTQYEPSRAMWVYSDFDRKTGCELFRYWSNQILGRTGEPFRVAGAGPDIGRVVQFVGSYEHDFIESMTGRASGVDLDAVSHAISSYRKRNAARQDKEVAIVELAGVLEQRRKSVLEASLSKDELELFNILNRFGLRHKRDDQRLDYDEIFLDWIFLRCLSTIALVDRLLARGSPG